MITKLFKLHTLTLTSPSQDGTPTTKTFEHLPSMIGAEEAEEVGVEHLLRDIKDTTAGTLSQRVTDQLVGLQGHVLTIRYSVHWCTCTITLVNIVFCCFLQFISQL